MTFTPLGERNEITLTPGQVRSFISCRTKSGKPAPDVEILKFLQLCRAQELNPWTSDAYLIGYESNGNLNFSLIVGIYALYKRAEINPQYNGLESGIIYEIDDEYIEEPGSVLPKGAKLVGGWARVHRRDRDIPTFERVNLAVYNTNRSRWAADPAGMIKKVAEAAALRRSFPNTNGALYVAEEMRDIPSVARIPDPSNDPPKSKADRITSQMAVSRPAPASPRYEEEEESDYDEPDYDDDHIEGEVVNGGDEEPEDPGEPEEKPTRFFYQPDTDAGSVEQWIYTAETLQDIADIGKRITAMRSSEQISNAQSTTLRRLLKDRETELNAQ